MPDLEKLALFLVPIHKIALFSHGIWDWNFEIKYKIVLLYHNPISQRKPIRWKKNKLKHTQKIVW